MDYIEVSIKIEPFSDDNADIVIAQIGELPFESFTAEESYVKAYIQEKNFSARDLKMLLSAFDGAGIVNVSFEYSLVKGQNWNALWESNFSPITVENLCTIKASFHKNLPKTRYNIIIDPKMAFGTGHHQTTHLMVKNLLEESVKGKKVLDMGCGTAILAILAAKMGAQAPVAAIDIDPDAVASAFENAKRNRVAAKISAHEGEASLIASFGKFDLILANINRNIVIADMQSYSNALVPEGVMLLSGFYEKDVEMVVKAGESAGLRFVSSDGRDDWAFVRLQKGKNG